MGGITEGVVVQRIEGTVVKECHMFSGSNVEKINLDAEGKFRELAQKYASKRVMENIESHLELGSFAYHNPEGDDNSFSVVITHADTARID